MGIFDKVKNSSIASKTKEFQENQKEKQKDKQQFHREPPTCLIVSEFRFPVYLISTIMT